MRRHRHDSLPGSGLRRSQVQPSIDVVGRSLNPDRSMEQVDVPTLEAQHLPDAQVTPGCQLHGDAPPLRHRCDEGVDLGDGHHGPFGRPLLRRSLHHARVAPNELVGDSGRQNPLEEPICLRRRDRVTPRKLGVPRTHCCWGEPLDWDRPKCREEMIPQHRGVHLDCPGAKIGPLLQPRPRIVQVIFGHTGHSRTQRDVRNREDCTLAVTDWCASNKVRRTASLRT